MSWGFSLAAAILFNLKVSSWAQEDNLIISVIQFTIIPSYSFDKFPLKLKVVPDSVGMVKISMDRARPSSLIFSEELVSTKIR